jgi:hypothetical protein
MKTSSITHPSTSSSEGLASPSTPAPCDHAPGEQARPGRPSYLNERMIDALRAVIRETGVSDSGAAARVSLHPSTLSRWKKEYPDLAILLRSAREEFRSAQLDCILATARAGHATSWRAAAWLLERTFPQDYASRARERAQFQEQFDAVCASEEEGGAVALPTKADPLQNVKNPPARAASPPAPDVTLDLSAAPRGDTMDFRTPETPLQNVKNSPLTGPLCPPTLTTQTGAL